MLTAISIACVVVFAPVLGFDFLGYDYTTHLLENPYLQPPVTWDALRRLWSQPYFRMYIPLTYSVWAAVVQITQAWSPSEFHALNLVLHTLNTLVVWCVIRRFGIQALAAGVGALVFALHPLQVESVAWISALKDVLSACLALLGINFWLWFATLADGAKAPRRRALVLAFSAFLLAVLAKPSAVVAPAVALILAQRLSRKPGAPPCSRPANLALIVWSLVIGSSVTWVALSAQPVQLIQDPAPWWARPLIATDSIGFWLRKIVWPVELAPDYGRTPRLVMLGEAFGWSWILPAIVTALVWWLYRRWPLGVYAWLVFLIASLPNWGLVSFGFQNISTVADRYVYLALLGVALFVASSLASQRSRVLVPVGVGISLVLAGLTSQQLKSWQNTESLFAMMLMRNPASFTAAHGLAYAAHRKGDLARAMPLYEQALRHHPRFADAYTNLATAYYQSGNYAAAIANFEKALSLAPDDGVTLTNLGLALEKSGRDGEAIERYAAAINATRSPYAAFHLGNLLERRGERNDAIRALHLAVTVMPRMADAWEKLGQLHLRRVELLQAEKCFREALAVDPSRSRSWIGLAHALQAQERMPEARAAHAKAVEIDPELGNVMSGPEAVETDGMNRGIK